MVNEETIRSALTQLSDELGKRGVMGELNLVGGTAMVLAFRARGATKDVDAIFEPAAEIRAAATHVAEQLGLPNDWLNDAAKGFLSPAGDFAPLSSLALANLRIQAPTPEYMLAMKVLASRSGASTERGDRQDIAFLIRLLRLNNAEDVLAIVQRYYDPSRILPRSQFLVDEILEEMRET
jgi:hypothetical protein